MVITDASLLGKDGQVFFFFFFYLEPPRNSFANVPQCQLKTKEELNFSWYYGAFSMLSFLLSLDLSVIWE